VICPLCSRNVDFSTWTFLSFAHSVYIALLNHNSRFKIGYLSLFSVTVEESSLSPDLAVSRLVIHYPTLNAPFSLPSTLPLDKECYDIDRQHSSSTLDYFKRVPGCKVSWV